MRALKTWRAFCRRRPTLAGFTVSALSQSPTAVISVVLGGPDNQWLIVTNFMVFVGCGFLFAKAFKIMRETALLRTTYLFTMKEDL